MAIKVFIPHIDFTLFEPRSLFLLCRPFLINKSWGNENNNFKTWNIEPDSIKYINRIEEANLVLIPFPINYYFENKKTSELDKINQLCSKYKIKAYAFIGGDWGIAFPEFENITYFRMGGFRSQLSDLNQGFPAALSDHYLRLFGKQEIDVREKQSKPVIGFCGHATLSFQKRVKENLKFVLENLKRAIQNPFRNDWEPLFASAYQRASLLKRLETSAQIETNFIYRNNYRAGYKTPEELEATTLEYYENVRNSDYVLCIRGGGNFSIRLYETLMMGRIPVFVNTDCFLPQTDRIDWKKHVIWVEWVDRKNIAKIVSNFHTYVHSDAFKAMQLANRELWKNELSVAGCLNYLNHLK